MVKVGVNGFGRIGRNVLRAALEKNYDIEFVAVNDLTGAATLAYLLKYDSVHRTIPNDVKHTDTSIVIDGKELTVFSNPDPAEIPWDDPRRGDRGRIVRPLHRQGQGLASSAQERRDRHHLRTVEGRRRHVLHGRERERLRSRESSGSSPTPRARRTASRRWRRCCTNASASRWAS